MDDLKGAKAFAGLVVVLFVIWITAIIVGLLIVASEAIWNLI